MIDQVLNRIRIKPLGLILCLTYGLPSSASEFLGVGAGYGLYRLNYLPDTGELNAPHNQLEADITSWRRQPTGWLSRGPAVYWRQGSGVRVYEVRAAIFHWHNHHGVWYLRQQATVENKATLSSVSGYLGNSGSPVDLGAGSELTSNWEMSRDHVFWQSDARRRGVANQAGLYRQSQRAPVEAEIEGITPEIFDGETTGWGVYIGKHQDSKGFNFQWRAYLGQHVATFSDENPSAGSFSESERRQIQFEGKFSWHYRYYLAPYWYLTPHLSWQLQLTLPSKSDTDNVTQKTLYYTEFESGVSIRRYF